MPASETVDFEREFEELVRGLRALPSVSAPQELRERVRTLGEPEDRRRLALRRPSRRALLVLAPACVLALVAAALVHGLVSSGGGGRSVDAFGHAPANHALQRMSPGVGRKHVYSLFPSALNGVGAAATPAPNPSRHQDYQAWLRVRVKDFDALGRRTADAMQTIRALGGYVASVDQSTTAGQPGQADLVLRVPVANVQTALIRLSALGTVLDQHVSIRDLNALVNAQRRRILQLRLEIARINAALQQSLPADVRLRLQFQLDQARQSLQQATGANAATLRTAAMSRIELTLTTQHAVAVTTHHRGRAGRAVHSAVAFLAAAGAIALAALIIVTPLALLAALLYWGIRAYRRREEARLLAPS
jgi:hypothetical protein